MMVSYSAPRALFYTLLKNSISNDRSGGSSTLVVLSTNFVRSSKHGNYYSRSSSEHTTSSIYHDIQQVVLVLVEAVVS